MFLCTHLPLYLFSLNSFCIAPSILIYYLTQISAISLSSPFLNFFQNFKLFSSAFIFSHIPQFLSHYLSESLILIIIHFSIQHLFPITSTQRMRFYYHRLAIISPVLSEVSMILTKSLRLSNYVYIWNQQ